MLRVCWFRLWGGGRRISGFDLEGFSFWTGIEHGWSYVALLGRRSGALIIENDFLFVLTFLCYHGYGSTCSVHTGVLRVEESWDWLALCFNYLRNVLVLSFSIWRAIIRIEYQLGSIVRSPRCSVDSLNFDCRPCRPYHPIMSNTATGIQLTFHDPPIQQSTNEKPNGLMVRIWRCFDTE